MMVKTILVSFEIEKLGPGTRSKFKGEALGQNISLNLVYTHVAPAPPPRPTPHTLTNF